ncbi:GNAT family N-acetyltransferase [Saccharibacillus sp. O23]|uniref:GNAT family N-acetyltransferase n=1 Tax=Saccharibacillus sp. O23 TaxID=2009338 RepID=UPI000B4E3203|nr:GNAT family N-acetyltransferase [Saccharibacillus sp. O23]OWR32361.1 GNAT family N-acetyltransferase [Saccharibacillus sp. O23]
MTLSYDRDFILTLRPLNAEDAAKINTWVYEPPYSLCSFSSDPDDLEDLMNGRYLGAFDKQGELIGFFCTGESAQVPGARLVGIYDEPGYLDIGLGLRPDLTGKGLGEAFLRQGIAYLTETFQTKKLRLAVAAFNKRAIEVYRHAGFREDRTFTSMVDLTNLPFISMVREKPAESAASRTEV